MIRIVHVIGQLRTGGAETVAMNILRYTSQDIFQNDFIVFGDKIGNLENEALKRGSKVHHIPFPKDGYMRFVKNIKKIITDNNYEIIHSHTLLNNGVVAYAARKTNIRLIISHSHSTNNGKETNNFIYHLYEKTMKKLIIRDSDLLISCGVDAGKYLYNDSPFDVINNGIDFLLYKFDLFNRKKIRNELACEENCILIGHVGRMEVVKNQEFLIKICEQFDKKKIKVKFLLIGDGSLKDSIQKKISDNNLNAQFKLLGNRQDVGKFLSAMDVMVFPSLYEGVPLTLVEAQVNGLPCVVSDTISSEVDIFKNVNFISLSENIDIWIKKIVDSKRIIVTQEMFECSGYDIMTEIKKMENIYLSKMR
ncbi:hypothetical protein CBF34_02730 [Vagococcus penaei]|uniref:glycosyltransferase n=1 Tax=Vagococcus penaei TaxID=633807 RepID=UPI000F88FE81|nr:glycosyltransferase [Vagococcus penaei]RSU06044.1 hypothetical protein CBF34_02730 [Vagococcus penaei]